MTEGAPDIHTIRFLELISSLDEATMAFLGKHAHPGTGETQVNLVMAQWNIEVLVALETKIGENLGDMEKKVLQQILSRLRLNFVDVVETTKKEKEGAASSGEKGEKGLDQAEPDPAGGEAENGAGEDEGKE